MNFSQKQTEILLGFMLVGMVILFAFALIEVGTYVHNEHPDRTGIVVSSYPIDCIGNCHTPYSYCIDSMNWCSLRNQVYEVNMNGILYSVWSECPAFNIGQTVTITYNFFHQDDNIDQWVFKNDSMCYPQ